jgi:cyclophilin family peptidyl-prolyl cis-trans isomerase
MKKISLILFTAFVLLFTGCSSSEPKTDELSGDILKTEVTENNNPIAVFQTTKGTFKLELFIDKSPITARNFRNLVESGFYDNTKFHRVIKDFMIQGGDPNSKDDTKQNLWGTGGSGTVIKDEFIEGLSNVRGSISMANSGPNSGSSQFFINVKDNTFLDWDKQPAQSKHPVFGQIIEGMDIIDSIVSSETVARDMPAQAIIITSVTLE